MTRACVICETSLRQRRQKGYAHRRDHLAGDRAGQPDAALPPIETRDPVSDDDSAHGKSGGNGPSKG